MASVAIALRGAAGGHTLVDPEDAEWASEFLWYMSATRPRYAIRKVWNGRTMTTVYLHREIAKPGDLQVDHINTDTLDNRRANLRVVTRAENMLAITRASRRSQSGIRGVTWFPDRRRYRAYIYVDGRRLTLGYFRSVDDAACAVQAKRCELLAHLSPVAGAR